MTPGGSQRARSQRAADPTAGPVVVPGREPRSRAISPAQMTTLVVCVVSIYFMISFYGKSLDSFRINQRATDARAQNVALEKQIKEVQDQVARLSTDDYLETTAREKLNLVKPGDHAVVILSNQVDFATVAEPPLPADVSPGYPRIGHLADWLTLFFGPH